MAKKDEIFKRPIKEWDEFEWVSIIGFAAIILFIILPAIFIG